MEPISAGLSERSGATDHFEKIREGIGFVDTDRKMMLAIRRFKIALEPRYLNASIGSNDTLRVGIDGSVLAGPLLAGVGRYVFELCRALNDAMPKARFFVYSPRLISLPIESGRWTLRIAKPLPRGLRTLHWRTVALKSLSRSDSLNLLWYAGGVMPVTLPSPSMRSVLTVYDLNHKVVPHTMNRKGLWIHRALIAPSIARASAVVTISAGTAEKLKFFYDRETDAVIPPGVSPECKASPPEKVDSCLSKYGLRKPYILAVGTREPRKNLGLLLQTFLRMKNEGLLRDHTLVFVGSKGWRNEQLDRLLESSVSRGVRALGYVLYSDLPALYSGCEVFVFPSVYEGYGIPISEARACGARVVATDMPETREAGDEATIYVSPTAEGLREGILQALAMPAPPLCQRSDNWLSSARRFADLMTRVCSSCQ